MSENDYIAEYIKEKYPEFIDTFDFSCWKLVKVFGEMFEAIKNGFDIIRVLERHKETEGINENEQGCDE